MTYMPKDESFIHYVVDEVLREVPGVTYRRMFDGWGIYRDGVFFCLVHDGQLYFKVDDQTKSEYKACGSKPFVYTGHDGKAITLTYWEVPASVVDDAIEIVPWVIAACKAALRSKKVRRVSF